MKPAHSKKIPCSTDALGSGQRQRRTDARLLMDHIMGDLSATLCEGNGTPGRLVDVSASGMQLATNAQLRPGQRHQVRCSALHVLATKAPVWAEVIWCQAGHAGLRFVDSVAAVTRFRHIFRRWCGRADPETILMWIDAVRAPS